MLEPTDVSPKTLGYEGWSKRDAGGTTDLCKGTAGTKESLGTRVRQIAFALFRPIPLVAAFSRVTLECPRGCRCFVVLPLWTSGRSMEAVVLLMRHQSGLKSIGF